MVVRVGGVYQFNRAMAVVDIVTDEKVLWHDDGAKSRAGRSVPRWYFEKYAEDARDG